MVGRVGTAEAGATIANSAEALALEPPVFPTDTAYVAESLDCTLVNRRERRVAPAIEAPFLVH